MTDFDTDIQQARQESLVLAGMPHSSRCQIIQEIATNISQNISPIITENSKDLQQAKSDGISTALLDRLVLNEDRLQSMVQGMQKIVDLPDPLSGSQAWTTENNLQIKKVKTPIGVILVVYEARPNVSTDTVALCLKTANAALLKGSRQTSHTNSIIGKITEEILSQYNLGNVMKFYPSLSHDQAHELVSNKNLDIIIPRGGEKLKKVVRESAKCSVLGAGGGVCHAYISEHANPEYTKQIIGNAKMQRPSVCNALESILVHESQLHLLPDLLAPLIDAGVIFHADPRIKELFVGQDQFTLSTSWGEEYLDMQVSIKVVGSLKEAIQHINQYSTGHSETIISSDQNEIDQFIQLVDSACVYANASTRFTDGEVFGFGAEIGISTQKLHARGPIGPAELTTYKYQIIGEGHIR